MLQNREEKQEKPAESIKTEPKASKQGLFDLGKLDRPLGAEDAPELPRTLDAMGLNDLLELRGRIDALLPPRSLAELDLEEEVLLQFARTKQLYDDVVKGTDTPANQKAQVANSCSAILQQLTVMQTKLYGAERTKALEAAVIRTLRGFPDEMQRRFFELYENALETLGLPAPTLTPLAAEPAPEAL